jgi:hypothetical protein
MQGQSKYLEIFVNALSKILLPRVARSFDDLFEIEARRNMRWTAWSTCPMTSSLKSYLKPEWPDPPVTTKSPSVRQTCKTTTYQRSFFIRATRTLNSLPTTLRSLGINIRQFKTALQSYYLTALRKCFNKEDPRTWKTMTMSICLKCNSNRYLRSKLENTCMQKPSPYWQNHYIFRKWSI